MFISLLVIQVLFVVAFTISTVYFQFNIIQDARGIVEPFQGANFDPDKIQAGQPLLEEVGSIYSSYQSMVKNMLLLIITIFSLYTLIASLIWAISLVIVKKLRNVSILKIWLKNILLSTMMFGPYLLLVYLLTKVSIFTLDVGPESFITLGVIMLILLFIIYYFFTTLTTFTDLKSLKDIFRKAKKTSKNIHKTLIIFLINWSLIVGSLYLMYLSMEFQEVDILVFITTIIFILTKTLSKVFWTTSLIELEHEKNNH